MTELRTDHKVHCDVPAAASEPTVPAAVWGPAVPTAALGPNVPAGQGGVPAARRARCPWAETSDYSRRYHDTRWCVPIHDDQELYAMLVLEGMQVGLSWDLILRREQGIRDLCDGLDPAICAGYDQERIQNLLAEPAMIRSQLKVASIVTNARALLRVQEQWGSFDAYDWHFTDGRVVDHRLMDGEELPAQDDLSRTVSADLKRRGFKFVGPLTTYSYLQGIGVVNDHLLSCPFHG